MANQISLSTSTSQRYRKDINMLSPYRINPNNTNKRTKKASNTNFENNSNPEPDVQRPQTTSNDFKPTSNNKPVRNEKTKLKSVANIEINEHYLDEILHNNNSQMELAMQIISKDKTVRNDTIQDLKEFNSQSLATQAKKEQLVSMMPAIKKAFDLMCHDIAELSTENDALKSKIGSYGEKWLQESENKILKQVDDEKEQF